MFTQIFKKHHDKDKGLSEDYYNDVYSNTLGPEAPPVIYNQPDVPSVPPISV